MRAPKSTQEDEICTGMNNMVTDIAQWFAIKTRQDFKAEQFLLNACDEVFFPKKTVMTQGKKPRIRAVIPHVLFIRTTRSNALALEAQGRKLSGQSLPFWIYRYPGNNEIQIIPPRAIHLLRLLTTVDTEGCRIYRPREFRISERVRVTAGIFKGYEGYVKRIDKNKHVVVGIEGVCMVILPYIHPDLLEKID